MSPGGRIFSGQLQDGAFVHGCRVCGNKSKVTLGLNLGDAVTKGLCFDSKTRSQASLDRGRLPPFCPLGLSRQLLDTQNLPPRVITFKHKRLLE